MILGIDNTKHPTRTEGVITFLCPVHPDSLVCVTVHHFVCVHRLNYVYLCGDMMVVLMLNDDGMVCG